MIDGRKHQLIRNIQVDGGVGKPVGVALSPDGRWLISANGLSNDVSVVDLPANAVSATMRAGTRPWGVALIY